jgi:hypothetical protein
MILIIGDSGMHKTWFLGTLPDPYIFDFDGGLAILRHVRPAVTFDTFKDTPRGEGWKTRKGPGFYNYGQAWPAFVKRLNEIGGAMDQGRNKYKFLCFDSITTMADSCMAYILTSDPDKGGGMPQIQHWGAQIQLMTKVFDQMVSWPIGKVFTAHIQRDTNDLTKMTEMLPLITGKLAGKMSVYFDEVWYVTTAKVRDSKGKEEVKWLIHVTPDGMRKQSKTRYGIPDETELTWSAVAPFITGASPGE